MRGMGWPIFGDSIYGNGPRFGEPRLHLHSREIVVPISRNKEPVRVVAPAPAHMHGGSRLRVERRVASPGRLWPERQPWFTKHSGLVSG